MPSLADLARRQTSLGEDDIAHLLRLAARWGLPGPPASQHGRTHRRSGPFGPA